MGRHDFGGPDEADGPVDLAAIVSDDEFLDTFGRHHRSASRTNRSTVGAVSPDSPEVDGSRTAGAPSTPIGPELNDLFLTWRAAIDGDPLPDPPSVDSVVVALTRTSRRRSLRSVLGVAVAICALLVGSAAMGARTAHPGDMLWPMTQVLWSDRAQSVVAGDTTRLALGQARMALDAGLTGEARSALVVASTVLPRVAERDGRRVLKADMDNLWSTLDWVQQQHAVITTAAPLTAPSPTRGPGTEVSVATTVPSVPADSSAGSSSPTSGGPSPTSSHPSDSSAGLGPEPSTAPPPTSALLPPAPTSSAPPPATSTAPVDPTVPTSPTEPTSSTGPSIPTSPATSEPSTPSSLAPSTDAPSPTDPSTATSQSQPWMTTPSATQEGLPVVPTDTSTPQPGEQSDDQRPAESTG